MKKMILILISIIVIMEVTKLFDKDLNTYYYMYNTENGYFYKNLDNKVLYITNDKIDNPKSVIKVKLDNYDIIEIK